MIDDHQHGPVHHDVDAGAATDEATGQLGQGREDERSEDGADQRAGPADDRAKQDLDGNGRPERERRIDEGEVLRIEGAPERGQEGGERHGPELGRQCVDARGLGGVLVLPDRCEHVTEPGALDPSG